jgi:hypothetical protein
MPCSRSFRHPCNEKPSVVADIGLRLQEGLQELKLEQQLAPTREAITRTLSAGQSNFFKAVEGVRGRWGLRTASSSSTSIDSLSSTPPVEISKADAQAGVDVIAEVVPLPPSTPSRQSTLESGTVPTEKTLTAFAGWGAGIGSLLSSAGGRFTIPMMGKPVEAEFATSTSALRSTTVPSPPASPNTPRADGFKAFKLIAQPPPARKVVEGYTNPHPSYVHEEDMYPSEEPAGVAL